MQFYLLVDFEQPFCTQFPFLTQSIRGIPWSIFKLKHAELTSLIWAIFFFLSFLFNSSSKLIGSPVRRIEEIIKLVLVWQLTRRSELLDNTNCWNAREPCTLCCRLLLLGNHGEMETMPGNQTVHKGASYSSSLLSRK